MSNSINRSLWAVPIIVLAVFLRFYHLDSLPAGMWGDVNEGYTFVQRVLSGDFYWRFEYGGDGPLFSYLVAVLSLKFGLSFFIIKAATAIVGIVLVIAVYFLTKEYLPPPIPLLTSYLMAVSKWSLIYSRMAKPHLLAALFSTLSFLFLLRTLKKRSMSIGVLTGICVGIGMYTQASFWGTPIAVFLIITLDLLKHGLREFRKTILLYCFVLIPFFVITTPLVRDFFFNRNIYFGQSSFFGEKLIQRETGKLSLFSKLENNLLKNLGMFTYLGSSGPRDNVPNTPALDFLSSIFFIIGIYVVLNQRKLIFFPLVFFSLQIPSLLDINNPASLPNMGRTITLFPWVYTIAALGLGSLWTRFNGSRFIKFFLSVCLLIITLSNYKQVFIDYPKSLPNHNVSYAKIIAREIDKQSPRTKIYVIGCCWGELGDPEPKSILFSSNRTRIINFVTLEENFSDTCFLSEPDPKYFIINPLQVALIQELNSCYPKSNLKVIHSEGYDVAATLIGI